MYRLYLKVNQRILYSNYGQVRFCLWIFYQEQSVTFLPSPSPRFCLLFYFRAKAHARKCPLIRISSGSKLGPHVYAFTSKFIDCKTVHIFAYSSTREQSNKRSGTKLKTESETAIRACEARALRARKTLTPRFTDFFTDFEKKTDCFAVYYIFE